MKKFSKLVGVALLASVFAFGFASCSNGSSDDDNNGNPNNYIIGNSNNKLLKDLIDNDAIAVFTGEDIGKGYTYCINCYSDGSFIEQFYDGNKTFVDSKGTYDLVSGTLDSGFAYIYITHVVDKSLELKELEEPLKTPVTIENRKFTLYAIPFYRTSYPVLFNGKLDAETSVTFKFCEDKTFEQFSYENSKPLTISKGTYEFKKGDFSNGTIVIKCKQFINNETNKLEPITNPKEYPDQTLEITNGKFIVESDITLTFSKL